MITVTAVDDKFIPGAIALFNSIKKNINEGEIDFYCLYFGEDSTKLKSTGMKVIDNPKYPDDLVFPIGGRWQKMDGYPDGLNPSKYAMPAMYARILLPKLFPDSERIFWIDADCIVLKSLKELSEIDFQGRSVAAIDISHELNGNFLSLYPNRGRGEKNGNRLGFKSFGCGVLLINTKVWEENRITEKCFDYMNTCQSKDELLSVVQGVLIMVVKDDFVSIAEDEYLFNVKRRDPGPNTKIIHFPIMIPWCQYDMSRKPQEFRDKVKTYWEPYR